MKKFILLHLLVISIISLPNQAPNEWQDADAAWLSNQIYKGVNTLDTEYGYVFHRHESNSYGAFAVWKQKKTGECYVVIRGTKTLSDIFTDLDVEEYYDQEIQVRVHSGVRKRTQFILENIDDKLKICTEDIIIAGHSLGGSIAYYLYLLYVKKHLEDWGQKIKASRLKAVLFAAPALTTKSGKEYLANFDSYVHWYKYGRDCIPFIISRVKGSLLFKIASQLFSSLSLGITKEAYDKVQKVNYGYHHPGQKYHLKNGEKKDYQLDFCGFDALALLDHMDFGKSVDIITKIWYKSSQFYIKNNTNTINCLEFLNEEDKSKRQESPSNSETIDIDTVECQDLSGYTDVIKLTNSILYMKKSTDDSSYIIKRLIDNEKEYEYAMCIDNKFILKQCNNQCQCHEVIKNDRPKEIARCNSYQVENSLNCFVDGNSKEIFLTEYFSVVRQIKIDNYYLMDYFCWNQTYSRGNYMTKQENNSMKMTTSMSIFLFLFLLFL